MELEVELSTGGMDHYCLFVEKNQLEILIWEAMVLV